MDRKKLAEFQIAVQNGDMATADETVKEILDQKLQDRYNAARMNLEESKNHMQYDFELGMYEIDKPSDSNSRKGKKYRLTDKTKEVDGKTLYQIKALRSFGSVKRGELGGYIEKESNLSHAKNSWVSGFAQVYGEALVNEDAQVYQQAVVFENAEIRGRAQVYGRASVRGDVDVSGDAKVYGNAMLGHDARVYDNAEVYDDALIIGHSKIGGKHKINGNTYVNERDYGPKAYRIGNDRYGHRYED